ncbi:CRAL/TRIO domain protein [Aspergillus heteromorphus CBS 117.55]|uniref:CRAL/TRIO domain protein n=1 Tax=Aspergillus heteromorphus CBS 117.55 TaxID=1448321 RepID=A0A317WY96_9EURO|nr:CRAL/TRIO domain protein [Aspergillus heteromorphus CBS 117.55]PWY90237.1 CRAL/TRIO domain protein [Aspergillus heteromorphus CBS 117.55]
MGDTTIDPAAALAAFRASCAQQGLLTPRDSLADGDVSDGLDDDATLLRFLEARKMDATAALQQFQEATQYRTDKRVLRVYDLISVEDHDETRKLYPHWTGRRDRRGMPLLMLDVVHLNAAAMAGWRKTRDTSQASQTPSIVPDMAQRAFVHFDGLTRCVLPLCAAVRDRSDGPVPITRSVYVVDASTVSIRQAWDLRDFAQEISGMLATCYPETIDRILVCNIPFFFARIWSFMKRFMDPITAAKLVMLPSADVYPTLVGLIDHEDIPRQFGGAFNYTHAMLPDLDPGLRQRLSWTDPTREELPPGPIKWMVNSQGERRLVATGTTDGLQRAEEIAVLHPVESASA